MVHDFLKVVEYLIILMVVHMKELMMASYLVVPYSWSIHKDTLHLQNFKELHFHEINCSFIMRKHVNLYKRR